MPFFRKRAVTQDGVTVMVSGLLNLQVEEFLASQQAIFEDKETPATDRAKKLEETWLAFVCQGMKNANPESAVDPKSVLLDYEKQFLLDVVKPVIMEMSNIGMRGEVLSA